MHTVLTLDQYKDYYVNFCEPIKNNIINDSNFIRIFYSDGLMSLNGIYLLITLNDIICEKYYNKYKCTFNSFAHKELVDKIKIIEESILKKIDIKTKPSQCKIYDQFKNGNIKLFNDIEEKLSCTFILKISGIWETTLNYGLTYKFIKTN
jgi:hypothetical protein